MRFRVRNKSEKPAAARCAVSAMSSAGRWQFFSVMAVLVSILLEVAGNVWADGGVISTFLNWMVNAAWYEDGGSTLVIYALVLPFVFFNSAPCSGRTGRENED